MELVLHREAPLMRWGTIHCSWASTGTVCWRDRPTSVYTQTLAGAALTETVIRTTGQDWTLILLLRLLGHGTLWLETTVKAMVAGFDGLRNGGLLDPVVGQGEAACGRRQPWSARRARGLGLTPDVWCYVARAGEADGSPSWLQQRPTKADTSTSAATRIPGTLHEVSCAGRREAEACGAYAPGRFRREDQGTGRGARSRGLETRPGETERLVKLHMWEERLLCARSRYEKHMEGDVP